MCDYSLGKIKNRLARDGEVLLVHRFSTNAVGLTSQEYLESNQECAVCVPDGSRMRIEVPQFHWFWRSKRSEEEEVVFRQVSLNSGNFRDSIQFQNGQILSLQMLKTGRRVKVLSTSPVSASESAPSEQRPPVRV